MHPSTLLASALLGPNVKAHYGGTLTPKGIGRRPRAGTSLRAELILEKLVRFDIAKAQGQALLTDHDIARVLGRSVRSIMNMRTRISYLQKRMEITTGITVDAANFVAESSVRHKQMLRLAMPDALRAVVDTLHMQTTTLAEKKFKFEVAKEILDREGSFPKISRTDVHQKIEHDFSSIDGVSAELLSAIEGEPQGKESELSIINALEANKAFSNSETLGQDEQQAALAALEAIPLSSESVN